MEVPVSLAQAALGATLDVLSLDGMVELKVPPGSQPGAKLLMRGKGIKRVNTAGRGNQYVHLNLAVPRTLTAKQKELLEAFREEEEALGIGGKTSGKGKGSGAADPHSTFADLCSKTFGKLKSYLKTDK